LFEDKKKPRDINKKLISFLIEDNPFNFVKENNIDEVGFTKEYLLSKIKNSFSEELNCGLVIKGPGDVAFPRFEFLNAISITDIVFIYDSENIISIEIKIIDSQSNRNQNISTAIGQGIMQSLGKYKYSIIYILDLTTGNYENDINLLKNKLSNIDVDLVYKKDN
jgi:hypothetical protein